MKKLLPRRARIKTQTWMKFEANCFITIKWLGWVETHRELGLIVMRPAGISERDNTLAGNRENKQNRNEKEFCPLNFFLFLSRRENMKSSFISSLFVLRIDRYTVPPRRSPFLIDFSTWWIRALLLYQTHSTAIEFFLALALPFRPWLPFWTTERLRLESFSRRR